MAELCAVMFVAVHPAKPVASNAANAAVLKPLVMKTPGKIVVILVVLDQKHNQNTLRQGSLDWLNFSHFFGGQVAKNRKNVTITSNYGNQFQRTIVGITAMPITIGRMKSVTGIDIFAGSE